MKIPTKTSVLTLFAVFLIAACNDSEKNHATTSPDAANPAKGASEGNPEWDDKLAKVATMMKEQRESKELIEFVRSAAVNADTVYPYLQSVMAGDAEEDKKSASLFIFTAGYMLVTNGHANVPSKAQEYIDSMVDGSKSAENLLDNQDLVPTYKSYRYTIDK